MRKAPGIGEPLWSDKSKIEILIASCRLALARYRKKHAEKEIQVIAVPISSIAAKQNAHPLTKDLLLAIRQRNVDRFSQIVNKLKNLEKEKLQVQKVDESLSKMSLLVPKLTDELKQTCGNACWDVRLPQFRAAWHWSQARNWIEEYIRKEDVPALAKSAEQIENDINNTIGRLASLHAWSFCFSRLNQTHRRNMKAWQKNVSKITKSGTGKQDYFHRREAQKNLNNCREAIPAWVMPLHRLWDTVSPEPGMFELIIVDEASQCGFEALPLFYLAKKILIVGDDKQISPEAEGVKLEPVTQLIDRFLYDFAYKAAFNINRSLFDQGELRYSSNHIVLREHFRCMPEIIGFSNTLCYSDTPLIPLRQYGPKRLTPIEHIFIPGGYREGSSNRVTNPPEAEAIAEKIVELSFDNKYINKTMGVIVLQGKAQAGLIETQLLERLGAEEMERRRLVCGVPYSFQGDERDIMFLSMVAANNVSIGPLTRAADVRRFNVAASRARDQMYLFHSVTCDELSMHCLRRRLLEFFENTKPEPIPGIELEELERRAFQDNRSVVKPPKPFESWFDSSLTVRKFLFSYFN